MCNFVWHLQLHLLIADQIFYWNSSLSCCSPTPHTSSSLWRRCLIVDLLAVITCERVVAISLNGVCRKEWGRVMLESVGGLSWSDRTWGERVEWKWVGFWSISEFSAIFDSSWWCEYSFECVCGGEGVFVLPIHERFTVSEGLERGRTGGCGRALSWEGGCSDRGVFDGGWVLCPLPPLAFFRSLFSSRVMLRIASTECNSLNIWAELSLCSWRTEQEIRYNSYWHEPFSAITIIQ